MSDFRSTLISYNNYLENGLFELMELPEGIDKDTLIDVIMLECGEMCPVWTDPDFMKSMIGSWSKKWQLTFAKWYDAISADYDPISNYDRNESWTTNTSSSSSSDSTANRSSYDSATLQPYTSMNDSGTFGGVETRSGRAWGNIGVTTSQQMINASLDLYKWNLYEHIKDVFMNDFLIMIY